MAQRDNSGAAIKLNRPLDGRQWRTTKARRTGDNPSPIAPPATRSSALPRRASADAERELARKIADKYMTRDGRPVGGSR
jgi:hypothetical protein